MSKVDNQLQQLFFLALLQKTVEIKEARALLGNFVYFVYLPEISKTEFEREPVSRSGFFVSNDGLIATNYQMN